MALDNAAGTDFGAFLFLATAHPGFFFDFFKLEPFGSRDPDLSPIYISTLKLNTVVCVSAEKSIGAIPVEGLWRARPAGGGAVSLTVILQDAYGWGCIGSLR